MIRTQIYLTEQENKALALLANLEGRAKSELIREIIDEKLRLGSPKQAAQAARKAFGAWKGKATKQYLNQIRKYW